MYLSSWLILKSVMMVMVPEEFRLRGEKSAFIWIPLDMFALNVVGIVGMGVGCGVGGCEMDAPPWRRWRRRRRRRRRRTHPIFSSMQRGSIR